MKEWIIKLLFYIWFLILTSVILFIPFYTIGMFVAIVSLMTNTGITVMMVAKISFYISLVISLWGMWMSEEVVEKTYKEIRNRKD